MNPDRIDLETKVAFLERTVDALSSAIHEQAQALHSLETRLSRFEKRSDSATSGPDVGPHDSPPPHY